jgi:hypothetical protein
MNITRGYGEGYCVLAVLSLGALAFPGCNDSPSGPSEETALSQTQETASIVFHYSRNDYVEAEREEAFCEWVVSQLGVSPTRKISYNKYLTRAHMGQLTGAYDTNGFAQPAEFALHTLWAFDNHEPVHLYASLFGSGVALLNEGIAVSFQTDPAGNDFVPKWNNQPLHDLARRFRRQGTLVPLDSLLETEEFLKASADVRYPESGSFVLFLRETRGLDRLKALLAAGSADDSRATLRASFERVYGVPLEQIEREWLALLDGG